MTQATTPRTLGILGGGQLAQMLALAAIPLGVRVVVLEPDPQAPARLCAEHIQAPYDDPAGLDRLAACDAVTLEFENVPVAASRALQGRVPLRPSPALLEHSKHRAREKTMLSAAGAAVAPYRVIEAEADLGGALAAVGGEGFLKTSELGYDGKGQRPVSSDPELQAAWTALGRVPCVLEGRVPFVREVSLAVARDPDGALACGPLIENLHRDGILRRSVWPAGSPTGTEDRARELARRVARHLDLRGLITLEFFELPSGHLLVNELAPRVHNSGHLTQDGGGVSQFEVAVRAALGLPIRDFAPLLPCAMVNVLGPAGGHEPDWAALEALPGARLHRYHKAARPGRKIGHVNVVGRSPAEVAAAVAQIGAALGEPASGE